MNKLYVALILGFTLLVSGCSTLAPLYDNNEYELLARLETSVMLVNESCDDPDTVKSYIPDLVYDSRLLHTYAFYLPRNEVVYNMTVILRDDMAEFQKQYDENKASPTYCNLKSRIFLQKVRRTLEAVGDAPRESFL